MITAKKENKYQASADENEGEKKGKRVRRSVF